MDEKELALACREVVGHFEGDVAITLFEYYDAINNRFFNNALPQAFIITALTPYGSCIGLTKHMPKQPIILIHPNQDTKEKQFYVLIHEAIHVYVRYCLGYIGGSGQSSHSHDKWLGEVRRIAPVLGYRDGVFSANKVRRLPKSEGGKLVRTPQEGALPYECVYRFPMALPDHTGIPLPPIEQWLD